MVYERLNLKNGAVLDETHIKHIEDGICEIEKNSVAINHTHTPSSIGAIAITDKPNGTYTGGIANQKVSVGGIGDVLTVWASGVESIITPTGAVTWTTNQTGGFNSNITFKNGVLTLSSDITSNLMLNGSGTIYNYQVL